MMKPLTPILKPGPISRGIAEKRALLGKAFELTADSSDCRREIPSLVWDGAVGRDSGAGASGSVGEAL